MTTLNLHLPRKHSTDGRHPETKLKVPVFCFTCVPCQVYSKTFLSRAARDRFADTHK